ncbi:hypothetical protein, partial [Mesorhizobium sp. M1C.F.Ca.ET.187.01.1.1]|uniref:hypothetical protein n=1 Tax=Mesorhizobium sp. M1C.F.Ca.ET.187.01.1.1 TaxID=2563923 RepID=UPI001AEEFD61
MSIRASFLKDVPTRRPPCVAEGRTPDATLAGFVARKRRRVGTGRVCAVTALLQEEAPLTLNRLGDEAGDDLDAAQ